MAGRDDAFEGVQLGIFEDKESLAKCFNKHVKTKDVFFLCVGTDHISGDSFAPFVGNYLKELGYENVLGTIDEPVHGVNLDEYIAKIPSGKTVIAIDASLGKEENIGKLIFNTGKLQPGKGVGKKLTAVGDFNIHGVVNKKIELGNNKKIELLAHTRLRVVLKLAKQCADAIEVSFPLEKQGNNRILKIM